MRWRGIFEQRIEAEHRVRGEADDKRRQKLSQKIELLVRESKEATTSETTFYNLRFTAHFDAALIITIYYYYYYHFCWGKQRATKGFSTPLQLLSALPASFSFVSFLTFGGEKGERKKGGKFLLQGLHKQVPYLSKGQKDQTYRQSSLIADYHTLSE